MKTLQHNGFTRAGGAFAAMMAALVVAGACSAAPEADSSTAVTVGISGAVSDAPFYLADALGYFKQENLDVELKNFASSSDMIAPLGTGDLQVGASGPTAALYNAIERGVKVRIVADKGRVLPKTSFEAILVDKRLFDSGTVKSMKDLKGKVVADYAESSTTSAFLNAGLEGAGLTLKDIKRTYLTGSQHLAALQNGSVVASVTPEPFATAAVDSGFAVRLPESDTIYPDQQTSVVLFGERFGQESAAQRFMKAYLQGARAFNDAIGADGKLTGPKADEVIRILSERASTPAETLRKIVVNGVSPDGELNMSSLQRDLDFFKAGGWLTNPSMTLQDSVNPSFAQRAAQELGPYQG
ncbi:ABC transporter substrate-binding protein [Acrocarpospora sp. B8E8]|uniref:ABC transporter substrate-binding protein n=1 Tax=Acrocarpospora sp. B8E8 TaxID=3153572 RepID=UPI00325F72A1